MQDFKFVHAADIHLDSPMKGLARYDGAPAERLRDATRVALTNLVQLAIDVGAKFVVISGDLYDGTWRDMRTGLFAVEQFAALVAAGIRVFVIYGNHDAESRITRGLTPPEGVYIFGHKKCETVPLPDLGVAIHGQSFKVAHTVENLARGYCPPTPGMLNIALLHTALEGGHSHASYAPCRLDELAASGHDYWALGHVHDFGIKRVEPYVVYPGNLQGRSVRETGAKGAVVVQVENGRIARAEHHPLDEARWSVLKLPTVGMKDRREFIDAVDDVIASAASGSEGRLLVTRVDLRLAGPLAALVAAERAFFEAEVRLAGVRTGVDCWIEKVLFTHEATVDYELPPVLEEILGSAHEDDDCLGAVRSELDSLIGRLPPEAFDEQTTPLLMAARRGDLASIVSESRALLALKLKGETL